MPADDDTKAGGGDEVGKPKVTEEDIKRNYVIEKDGTVVMAEEGEELRTFAGRINEESKE